MKNRINYQLSLWTYVLIGLLSFLVMQCSCSPRFSAEGEPSSKQQGSQELPESQNPQESQGPQDPPESQKPQESQGPQGPSESQKPQGPQESPGSQDLPPLNSITDEMIQAAEKAGKHFLADQLRNLQKEDPTKRHMAYINDKTDEEITALYQATDASFQRPDIVQALLDRGADPDIKNSASDTPLGSAVASTPEQNLQTIGLLLEAGADPFGGKKGFGPIYSVIANTDQDTSIFEFILSKMPYIIHKQDDNGDTVLHYAVILEKEKAIKLLLTDRKADPNMVNKQNQTPQDLAKLKNKNIRALFGLP